MHMKEEGGTDVCTYIYIYNVHIGRNQLFTSIKRIPYHNKLLIQMPLRNIYVKL